MSLRDLPKVRDSLSYVYVEHCRIDRDEHAIRARDADGDLHIPCAALAALLLGPGTSITHAAMKTLADAGCSVLWVGEDGLRMYAQGLGETRSSRRLLRQAERYADPRLRAAVVRRMYEARFAEPLQEGLTLAQVRGMEGVRVRTTYQRLSREHGITWRGRRYVRGAWDSTDAVNRALSAAATCLYAVSHAAIVSAGYSTALGFIHTGKLLSFVYDVADLYRMDVVAPVAFEIAARYKDQSNLRGLDADVRRGCRDAFRRIGLMDRIVSDIDRMLDVDAEEIERASEWIDGVLEGVGALWDPAVDDGIPGGVNYGDLDLAESPDDPPR